MAAPGDNTPRLCEKCFATFDADAPFCPECGAALDSETHSDGSDVAIYPELARANLLRMRGDYKAAEDVCLGILRRFPNNATANGLLGDICVERGDLEQAAEWYELALDIVSDADAVRAKLEGVRARLAERESAHTAQKIGLPMSAPRNGIYALATIILILAVGIGSYFFGSRASRPAPPVMDTRIDVSSRSPETAPPANETPPQKEEPPAPRASGPWTDAALVQALRGTLADGLRLLDAWEDPRTRALTLTVSGGANEPARTLAARIGLATLQAHPIAPVVTVRVVLPDKLVYVGDATREGALAVAASTFEEESAHDPDLWIDRVMANEWEASPTTGTEESR